MPKIWPYRFRIRFRKVPKVIVLSQAAMGSPEGSWAVLAGKRPNKRTFGIAIEEDQKKDDERWHHILEPVDYMAFSDIGSIDLGEP